MKRQLFLGLSLLAIAGMWTGCSSDEVIDTTSREARAIDFRVQGGVPESRTTATTADHIDAFVVYGTDNVAGGLGTPVNIFDGVTVARLKATNANTPGAFDYNPKRYYSESAASANFVAYSPVSTSVVPTVEAPLTGTDAVKFAYTVAPPAAGTAGSTVQEDLLVAGVQPTVTDNKVSFTFTHALSRIFVKAYNPLSETITIKSLELKNLKSEGIITGTAAATWTWSWGDTQATPEDYPFILAASGVAVPANTTNDTKILVTSMEQGMMILPQTTVDSGSQVAASDFHLAVSYTIGNQANVLTRNVFIGSSTTFAINTQYAITIGFTGHTAISFEIANVGAFGNDPNTMP